MLAVGGRRPSGRRSRGASLVEYLVVVAIVLGIVLVAVVRFAGAVRTAAACEGSAVTNVSGGGDRVPCGRTSGATLTSANVAGGNAAGGAHAAPEHEPGGLACDALGCRTSGDASGTTGGGGGKAAAPAAAPATADPKNDYDAVRYGMIRGTPFIVGKDHDRAVHPADISQGRIADCYFVSSLASLANVHPELLQRNITPLGNNRYGVRLFVKGQWTTVETVNQFPTTSRRWSKTDKQWYWYENGGDPVYARPGQTSDKGAELWPMLYEQAYAKANGGWNAIGNGGSAGDALTALTGQSSVVEDPSKMTFATVAGYVNGGYAVVGGTRPKPKPGEDEHALFKDDTISHWHAYWVEKVDTKNETITVRDPWGWNEHVVVLTWDQFKGVMTAVNANPVTARKRKWLPW